MVWSASMPGRTPEGSACMPCDLDLVTSSTSDHHYIVSFMQVTQPAASQQRFSRLVPRSTIDDLEIQELVHKLDDMVSTISASTCSICTIMHTACKSLKFQTPGQQHMFWATMCFVPAGELHNIKRTPAIMPQTAATGVLLCSLLSSQTPLQLTFTP